MLRFRRPAVSLLVMLTLWPTLVFGQGVKAGVVTTLEGNVTAARATVPQPVSLKFKDDVFLQDKITTGDRSVARLLLGGAAVVTVRERSVLTITEVPGKSTVNLESGKIALTVARERMRAGESLEIRTPNAVAGVRGTVVVAEVSRATAQVGAGSPVVVSAFYVLQGVIEALQLDPVTLNPVGVAALVNVLQSFTVAGGAAGRIEPIRPDQIGQIRSGLAPSAPQHTGTANQEQVSGQQVATAVSLINALIGPAGGTPTQEGAEQLLTLTGAPEPIIEGFGAVGVSTLTDIPLLPGESGGSISFLLTEPTPAPGPTGGPGLLIQGTTLVLLPGQTLLTFSGAQNLTSDPIVQLIDAGVIHLGFDSTLVVDVGAAITLATTLLDASNSSLTVGDTLLQILGSLTSTGTAPLIALDPTTVTTTNDFIHVAAGGSLTVAAPLLVDLGGTYNIGFDFLDVEGGTLTSTGLGALLQFTDSTVTIGADSQLTYLFRVIEPGATASLAGPLVSATNSDLTVLGHALFEAFDSGVFTGTGTGPLIELTGGSLTLGAGVNFLFVSNSGSATLAGGLFKATGTTLTPDTAVPFISLRNGGVLTVGGPLLDLIGTSLDIGTTQALVDLDNGSTVNVTAGPAIRLDGSSLTAEQLFDGSGQGNVVTLVGTLLDATNSTVTLAAIFDTSTTGSTDQLAVTLGVNEPLIRLTSSSLTLTRAGETLVDANVDSGSPVTLGGVALIATGGSTLTLAGSLLELGGVTLTDPNAQVQLSQTTVNQTGVFSLIDIFGQAVTAMGPLLEAIQSTLTVSDLVLGIFGPFTATTTSPLVNLVSSAVTSSGGLIQICCDGNSVSLAAELLDTTGGSITVGDFLIAIEDVALSFGPTPVGLVSLDGTAVSGTGVLIDICCGASVTLGGQLLNASGGSIAVDGAVLRISSSTTVTGTSALPVIQLADTPVSGTVLLDLFGTATLDLTGTLLSATYTTGGLSLTTGLVSVFAGGALISASTDPLVLLSGGTHSIASVAGTAMFDLAGINTAVQVVGDVDLSASLELGTDEPIQTGGVLFQTSGATVSGQQIVRVDTALLEATMPIVNLTAGSAVTTSVDAIQLAFKAHLNSTGTELVKIDASTLTVSSGALVSVTGGSALTVAGNLLTIANGATVNILNGVLLNVTGGGFASVTGALVNFVGSSNTLNVTNTLVPNVYLNGIPIFKAGVTETIVANTASPAFVGLNSSGNTININGTALVNGATSGYTGSLIAVGGGGKVKLGGPIPQ
ncbi:MAG: FecR domain-containing protein [Candidatus Rokubacteria bacterium]|nr:FecR domain-containing protein [Candidatus Rokubacteria bacterium]